MRINKLSNTLVIMSIVFFASGTAFSASIKKSEHHKHEPSLSNYEDAFRFGVSMKGGRLAKVVFYRVADKKVYSKVFPHGRGYAKDHDPEKIYTMAEFKNLIKDLIEDELHQPITRSHVISAAPTNTTSPLNGAAVMAATSPTTPCTSNGSCITGMGIGYNNSTGYLGNGSQCYNYTISLGSLLGNTSFSSQNSASSQAGQTSVSASISASVDAFSADDTFSYTNEYSNSQNSGQVFFNASQIATAAFTLAADPTSGLITPASGLNSTGNQQVQAGTFSEQCGSYVLSSAPVGMLITGQFSWSSSSSSNSTAVNNEVKGNYGLNSISLAVSAATQSSTVKNSFDFTTSLEGGSTSAASVWYSCIGASALISAQDSCMAGNVASCNTFTADMDACAINTLNAYNTSIANVTNGSSYDMSIATVFPYGVKGVTTPAGTVNSISTLFGNSLTSTDPFSGTTAQALSNYTNILNQISTLNNRLSYLSSGLGTYTLNPSPNLNLITNYITPLQAVYSADVTTFEANIKNCLANNTSSSCTTINNLNTNGVHSAFDWYGSSTYNPNASLAAQQNTIALQYTGSVTYTGCCNMSFPVDVMWINALPNPFTYQPTTANQAGLNQSFTPNGLPALIAFADAPYEFNLVLRTAAWVTMFTQAKGSDLSTAPLNFTNYSESLTNTSWYSDTGYGSAPQLIGLNPCTALSFNGTCTLSSVAHNTASGGFYLTTDIAPLVNFFPPQVTIQLQ